MHSFRRYIFNTLTALSLLLLLLTVGLWVHSYGYEDTQPPAPVDVKIASGRGVIELHSIDELDQEYARLIDMIPAAGIHGSGISFPLEDWEELEGPGGYDGQKNGFDVPRNTESDVLWTSWHSWALSDVQYYFGSNDWSMMVPHWFLTLLLTILPGYLADQMA